MKALVAKFGAPEALVSAVERLQEEGLHRLDAYTPFPLEQVVERLGPSTARIGWTAALAALAGGGLTYLTVYWTAVIDYPLNIGGRPLHSWAAFLPSVIVAAALWSAVATLIAMIVWCGLPRWHHPLFDLKQFDRASYDKFFLLVDCADPSFEPERTRRLIESLDPERIDEVEL